MLNIGVMVSGGGTNLQAIIDNIENGKLKNCRIACVVSSKNGAYALERAKKYGIPSKVIQRKAFSTLEEYDNKLIEYFEDYDADLIVLAGFLSLLGEKFVRHYENRIINIHPSLIPAFCGKGYYGIIPHKEAIKRGVKVTGATVHFVNTEYDSGPIIIQKPVYVNDDDTPELLQERVMKEAEHLILPEAIKLYSEGRLLISGNRVIIKNDKY